jgi:hypothetical protein
MAKHTITVLSLATLLSCMSAQGARTQEEQDNSGTNPAVLSRQLSKSNEYQFLADDYFFKTTNFRYTQPFAGGKASIRLTIPVNTTDLAGGDAEPGLGDIAAKLTWVPYFSKSQAFVLEAELYAPTASEEIVGTGKWVIAPGLAWVRFVSPDVIVAPAYIHNVSFAGDGDRPDVNRGDFDLYVVYKPHGESWWIASDSTISHDFEGKATPMSWSLTFGRSLMQLESGGALNGYVRPGVGIGHDRLYNFSIEVGINLINF